MREMDPSWQCGPVCAQLRNTAVVTPSSDYSYSCKTVLYGTVGYYVSEYTLVVSVSRVEDLLHVPVAELRYYS